MTTFVKEHSSIVLISLLLVLLALAWVFPAAGLKLGVAFLFASFCIASLAVLGTHQQAYRSGQITRAVFLRNAVLEITGTGLVMALAGLLGRYAAGVATQQIGNDLLRVAAGIVVGLVVGICVGTLAKKTWRRLVQVPFQR